MLAVSSLALRKVVVENDLVLAVASSGGGEGAHGCTTVGRADSIKISGEIGRKRLDRRSVSTTNLHKSGQRSLDSRGTIRSQRGIKRSHCVVIFGLEWANLWAD